MSGEVREFFLTEKPFAVFPNPISSTGELQIFSKAFSELDFEFRLFRTDGSLVVGMNITTDRESIPLNGIPAGLYVYHLTSEEGRFIGKLVVQ
jgi:hypothetical protein